MPENLDPDVDSSLPPTKLTDSHDGSAQPNPAARLGATRQVPQIVTVSISDLFVPDWNPRKLIREASLQDLMAFLKTGGEVPRLWVWKGDGNAKAGSELAPPNHLPRLEASAQGPYAVISGQRRLLAYQRLGVTELEVELYDIPLAKAVSMANSSNQNEDMHWWERYKGWAQSAKQLQGLSQRAIADELGTNQSEYNRSKQILEALNPAMQARLDSVLIKNPDSFPREPSFLP